MRRLSPTGAQLKNPRFRPEFGGVSKLPSRERGLKQTHFRAEYAGSTNPPFRAENGGLANLEGIGMQSVRKTKALRKQSFPESHERSSTEVARTSGQTLPTPVTELS